MIRRVLGIAFTLAFLTIGAAGAAGPPAGMPPLPPQPKVRPAGMPAGYMLVSPCIVAMGEHWGNLKLGIHGTPVYGTYQGKPIFTELMLKPSDFAQGKNFLNVLRPLPGYQIDHVDIMFLKHGHPGMTFAHYDIHAYYISPAAVRAVCPHGVPVPM